MLMIGFEVGKDSFIDVGVKLWICFIFTDPAESTRSRVQLNRETP
jgi:hypothetical protein